MSEVEHSTTTLERHKIPYIDPPMDNGNFWCKAKDVQKAILKLERKLTESDAEKESIGLTWINSIETYQVEPLKKERDFFKNALMNGTYGVRPDAFFGVLREKSNLQKSLDESIYKNSELRIMLKALSAALEDKITGKELK